MCSPLQLYFNSSADNNNCQLWMTRCEEGWESQTSLGQMNNNYYKMNRAIIAILALLLGYAAAFAPCNSTHPYVLAGVCYLQCPWNPPTVYYSYNLNYTCQATCPSPYYGFQGNKSCLTTCPATPNVTYYDDTNRKCVTVCPSNFYGANNRSCVASCPSGSWGDATAWLCVGSCPVGTYYANVTFPLCVTTCPANYYAYPPNRLCYAGGACPTSPVPYYSDDTTALCVTSCPANYFADTTTGRCLIYCSTNYFADQSSRTCVLNCPSGFFRSLVTRTCVRTCTTGYFADSATNNCTTQCTAGTFGDSLTGTCNSICTLPNYGDSTVKLCVPICSIGLYANNFTQSCVTASNCYSNTIGDPTTNKCISPQSCPTSPYMFADLTNKICTTRCATTYGDLTTRLCVASCPWNPQTYVTWINTDTRQCVTQCPAFPIQYADNQTQTCVTTCPQAPTVSYSTFANPSTQSCVRQCPTGFFSDSSSLTCVKNCSTIPNILFFNPLDGSCVSSCPTGYFSDLSKLTCVLSCSTSPQYFAHSVNKTCLSVCPTNYYGDLSTGTCVSNCPQTTKQYAQDTMHMCVDKCPYFPSEFGQIKPNGSRVCVGTCSVGLFADPLSRTCVLMCNVTGGYYGQLLTPVRTCLTQCPDGKFAQNSTGQCLGQCPSFPTLLFANPVTKICVAKCPPHLFGDSTTNACVLPPSCPSNTFADYYSNLCVKLCPANQSTFGDASLRLCVQVCPQGTFADPTTRLCSSSCNSTAALYKDPSTKSCVKICPSTPNLYADMNTMTCVSTCSNNFFTYDVTRRCLSICPSTPPYYGDYQTYRCVTSCPNQTYIFTNNTFRGCVANCPPRVYSALYTVNLYADNTTWSCVTLCPESKDLFNFAHPTISSIRTCVTTCPMVGSVYYFAQNVTQSCVLTCPSASKLSYGDIFNSKCVFNCSRNQYRDNSTSRCVYQCSPGFFADNTTWSCVQKCPAGYFAESINRTCSLHCPTNYYANNVTRLCQSLCDTETYLFSDHTTWTCVANCTSIPDMYADSFTKLCSLGCTNEMFADPNSRSCIPALNCSNYSLIGQPISGRCVNICPIEIPSFLDVPNNLCVSICASGLYADNSTMQCVAECPSTPDFYAYNHSTLNGLCVLLCPITPTKYYRHIPTRECLTACPAPSYFRDTINLICVTKCPPYYFAQTIDQICVLNCSSNSKYAFNVSCYSVCPNNLNADPTTFLCVEVCPFGYFAQAGICVVNCTSGYADSFLKVCVQICTPDYYAYNQTMQCRQDCYPYFKYFANQTCISSCPKTSNLSTNLYMDNTTFSCLNKCLPTWYADKITGYCTQTCSPTLLADNSTGLCVAVCPSSPDYYGFSLVCYFPCPAHSPPLFAENTTRTCMTLCPTGSFADSYNWRCVANCTGLQYGVFGPPRVCVNICPSPLYGEAVTKTCVPLCPNGTFGQNGTRLCLTRCPTGSFADTHLNLCVSTCSANIPQFADASTQRCVPVCPSVPSLYGQFTGSGPMCVPSCTITTNFTLNTTRLCVPNCPSPFFADPVTKDCAFYCQLSNSYYADNVSRTCSSTCPTVNLIHTYADDSTKKCVWTCPFNPSLYGNNATNKCVRKCPNLTYGDNDTRICHKTCFFNVVFNGVKKYTFAENTTTFCLYQCPPGSWADNLTYTCVQNCTQGYFADSSTWKCVFMCPSNPISYAYGPNKTCIYACPQGYFASEVGRVCLFKACPKTPFYYYKDFQNNQCVLKCVYPYFGQNSTQSCVKVCSYGFYQDLGAMTCSACPSTCATCINSGNCTTCKSTKLFLHQGACVTSCPTFPVYYYKYNVSFTCTANCPAPYFGFNGTGQCELNCPSTYFKNLTTSTCQDCPKGCSGCFGKNCSSCITGYVFVKKYRTCSKVCSLALPYFQAKKCVANCTSGTFLLDDLVTCQKCNSICAECAVVATNCTKCQNSFWYNYKCVSQCPSQYYVDKNNFCQLCSNNPSACILPPLNFTFSVTTNIRYQVIIIVTFNRPVKLSASQFPTVCKIKTKDGPLKPSQYKVSQTSDTKYQAKVLGGVSLNQQSLSLTFDPGAITDGSGIALSTTSVTTIVPETSGVTPQIQAQAQSLSKKVNIVGYILIALLVLMMFRCSYPQIVLLDLLQYIHLHAYILINPMPYLFIQVVSTLKNVNFGFLPALFTNPSPLQTGNYFIFQPQTTFLGNCQPFVFFLAIFGGSYLLFWLLSSRINKCRWLQKKAKAIFRGRMKFSFINEIFYYTQFYVLFFALYQFTGANSYIDASATNLAAAVIVFLCYLVWLVWITYLGVKYKNRLDKIPQKYKFLVYQASQFPMEIPFRGFFKLIVACVLIAGQASVQLMLLMIFNLIFIIYTLCFQPSKNKLTNILNTTLMVCFVVIQIVLFVYSSSSMSTSYQNTISLVLLALMGLMTLLVFAWIIYRLILFIREDIMGIKPKEEEKPKGSSKQSKYNYEKVKMPSSKKLTQLKEKQNIFDKQKDMISQLNLKDEQQQLSDAPEVTAEEAMQMFTYHHVPKKSQGLIQYEKNLMGVKQTKKRNNAPIIIEVDEDELLKVDERLGSRQSARLKKNRIKTAGKRGHLRMEDEDSLHQIQHINLKEKEAAESRDQKDSELLQNKSLKREQQSEESNYWTRKHRAASKQNQKQNEEHKVVWDMQGEQQIE